MFAFDPDLRNPWGIAVSPLVPILWIADNASGLSERYTMTGVKVQLVVTMPTNVLGENSPVTGVAFNPLSGAFNGDSFVFASEDGSIIGWRVGLGTAAEVLKPGSLGEVYKGTTSATINGHEYLYSADFHNAKIDILSGGLTVAAIRRRTDAVSRRAVSARDRRASRERRESAGQ